MPSVVCGNKTRGDSWLSLLCYIKQPFLVHYQKVRVGKLECHNSGVGQTVGVIRRITTRHRVPVAELDRLRQRSVSGVGQTDELIRMITTTIVYHTPYSNTGISDFGHPS